MRKVLSKEPFSKLSYEEKFQRLFWRGFTREEAEKKLRYPYKAIFLPGIIEKYWRRAKTNQQQLQEVVAELDGLGVMPFVVSDRSLLAGIADRILGDAYEYEIQTGKIIITKYNGVYVA